MRTTGLGLYSALALVTGAVVACSSSPSNEQGEPVSSTSEALVIPKCPVGEVVQCPDSDDCCGPEDGCKKLICPPCTCVAAPTPPPPTCTPPQEVNGTECSCPAGEVVSGSGCVPCGLLGDSICTASGTIGFTAACTASGTVSNGSQCVTCGVAGHPVCADGDCVQDNTVASSGTCVPCGGLNTATPEPVCSSPSTPNFGATGECTPAGSVASNGTCVACGTLGALICNATSNPSGVFKGPCTQANTASDGTDCRQLCVFDPSCPPGMYNTTPPLTNPGNGAQPCNLTASVPTTPPSLYGGQCNPGGYVSPATEGYVWPTSEGCSFTPPASAAACLTTYGGATSTVNEAQLVPAFQAPIITSVVLGGSTVYALGSPPPGQPGEQSGGPNAVFAWGNNADYQLGNATLEATTIPQVPIYYPPLASATQAPGVGGAPALEIQSLVAGNEDACVLVSDGSVHCWGTVMTYPNTVQWKADTQIVFPADPSTGIPGDPNQPTPDPIIQITHGASHACALTSKNHVYCWGNNDYEQLGAAPAAANSPPSIPNSTSGVPIYEVPIQSNFVAQPGNGLSTGNGVTPSTILSVVASGNTTCVLAQELGEAPQGVYCWGDNTEGSAGTNQLLQGNALSNYKNTEVGLGGTVSGLVGSSLGSEGKYGSFCAFVGAPGATGTITNGWFCWGADDQDQFGFTTPPSIVGANTFGAVAPAQLGQIGGVYSTTQIAGAPWLSVGVTHSCAQGGEATYCFGGNGDGQLGQPLSTAPILAGTALPAPPSVFPGASYSTPLALGGPGLLAQAAPIAAGNDLTCGIFVSQTPTYDATTGAATPGAYGLTDSFGNAIGNATGNLACWGSGAGLVNSYEATLLPW